MAPHFPENPAPAPTMAEHPAGHGSSQNAPRGPGDKSRQRATERKRRQREREADRGLAQFSSVVPPHVIPELQAICDMLRRHGHLEISPVPLRDPASGKLVPLRSKGAKP